MRFGPLAFLFGVAGAWAVGRAIMLWPGAPAVAPGTIAWAAPLRAAKPIPSTPFVSSAVETRASIWKSASRLRSKRTELGGASGQNVGRQITLSHRFAQQQALAVDPLPVTPERPPSRWSLSAWTLVRGEGAPGLVPAGQLAGSQAGLRLRYRLSPGLHLAARLSGPLQISLGKEAALALDVQPLSAVPVTVTIERRIGLDAGGRDAFALGAFGGFDTRLTPRLSVDGYAQAGVVGLQRRDAYIDGSLRIEREVAGNGKVRFGVGAGTWGGAQPGAARLDVGPQLVAHLPIASGGVRIGAEWRQRVAGKARPGSGPVLSLGADF